MYFNSSGPSCAFGRVFAVATVSGSFTGKAQRLQGSQGNENEVMTSGDQEAWLMHYGIVLTTRSVSANGASTWKALTARVQ